MLLVQTWDFQMVEMMELRKVDMMVALKECS